MYGLFELLTVRKPTQAHGVHGHEAKPQMSVVIRISSLVHSETSECLRVKRVATTTKFTSVLKAKVKVGE